jgi:hypothetical protein
MKKASMSESKTTAALAVVDGKSIDAPAKALGMDIRDEAARNSSELIRALASAGIAELVLVKWWREFELISKRNEQWAEWLDLLVASGAHVKPDVLMRYDEHRQMLTEQMVSLGGAIIDHVKSISSGKAPTAKAKSFVPSVNPIARAQADHKPVTASGAVPSPEEMVAAVTKKVVTGKA